MLTSRITCFYRLSVPQSSSCIHSIRCFGSAPEPRPSGLQASFKKGTGGRSSFSGTVVTVFGACGLYGPNIVNRLGKEGCQIILPYRGDPYEMRHFKPAGDLGQILFFPFQLRDEDSIRKAVKYSNVVINLIGRDFETKNFSFYDVHVEGAQRLARICKEMGVEKLIHISAMNASPNPPEYLIPGGSHFLRSKGLGEEAVRSEFPKAVIIRPSETFGHVDRFINYFMFFTRRTFPYKICLYRRGEETFKMPVFVSDVAAGIMKAIHDPTVDGETLEFVGPNCYRLGELVDWMYRYCQRSEEYCAYKRLHIGPRLTFKINFYEFKTRIYRKWHRLHWETIERTEANSDILTGCQTLEEYLGQPLHSIELDGRPQLEVHQRFGYLFPLYDEFPEPPPPPHYPPLRKRAPAIEEPQFKTFGEGAAHTATAFA